MNFPLSSLDRSLPDRMFFPLVAVLAVAMIFVAMEPFATRKPSGPMSGAGQAPLNLVIQGDDLYRFQAGRVGELTLADVKSESAQNTTLTIRLKKSDAYDTPQYGPHLELETDLERVYEGRRMRVTVEARASEEWGADEMEVNYSTGRFGESGWNQFQLTPEFEAYSFEYDVPRTDASMGLDYLAIRPVVPDKERRIDIRAIRFKSLSDKRKEDAG